jgi:hypothetical protein
VLLSALGVLGAVALPASAAAPRPATKHANLLVPLYDDANPTNWSRACSQANGSGDGSWIIADPAHGPGTAPLANWAKVIHDCYRYGRASVIGYVSTNYGRGGSADIPRIKQLIDKWYAFYPGDIAGIFLDEVSDAVPETGASNRVFYQTLASYIHTQKGDNDEVVLNFGANPGSDWMLNSTNAKNADLVVTFEGPYIPVDPNTLPYTAWQQASWELRYPASDFAALVYNAPNTSDTPQPTSACSRLRQQNIGYVYVGVWYTDPLPPYYEQLATAC